MNEPKVKTLREAIEAGALTIPEAAEKLSLSRSRVQDFIEEGTIKVVFKEKIGGAQPRYWLDREDVDREASGRGIEIEQS